MKISRAQLLEELVPGLNQLLGTEYSAKTEVGALRSIELSSGLHQVLSWDGKEWANVGSPVSKEEAEALLKLNR